MKKRLIQALVFLSILLILDRGIAWFITTGLEKYYGLDQDSDVLIVGHSLMMKSCDKEKIEQELGVNVSKYCREGVMVKDRYTMIKQFLSTQSKKTVPYVLYGVDHFLFSEGDLSLNSYKLFYPFMDNPIIDRYIRKESENKWHDYPIHKYIHCTRLTDNMIYRSVRGWCRYWTSFQNGKISDEQWNRHVNWSAYLPKATVQTFHETINLLLAHGCHIILVYPPVAEQYKKSNPKDFEYMINYFQNLAINHPQIDFLDYNEQLGHKQRIFEDSIHLNLQGCKEMTELLVEDLRTIICNTTKEIKVQHPERTHE